MKWNLLYTALYIIFILASCSPGDEAQDKFQIEVKEDVVLNLLPSLASGYSGLAFSFETQTNYACEDAGISYTIRTSPDDIDLHLLGIQIPDVCAGGNAPAREVIHMPGSPGTYTLAIDIGEVIHNTGFLQVESDDVKLYMNSQDGISIPYTTMQRMPEGTIWGYAIAESQEQQAALISQIDQYFSSYTEDAALVNGYYGYFTSGDPVGINILYPVYRYSTLSFAYKFKGNHADLDPIVSQLRQEIPSGAELKVYTWQGQQF